MDYFLLANFQLMKFLDDLGCIIVTVLRISIGNETLGTWRCHCRTLKKVLVDSALFKESLLK